MSQELELKQGFLYNKKFIIIIAIAALFIGIACYVYYYYISPRINPSFVTNKELINKSDDLEGVELYYFYTQWCPYCKKAEPVWNKVKEVYNGKKINGVTVYFKEVDCEKNEKMADQFGIEAYPTIKLIKGDQIVDYDAKPDEKTLTQFLQTTV